MVKRALALSLAAASMLVAVGSAHGQVPQQERDALIALYNATNGAGWSDNTGWLGAPGTECTWYGVTCSGSNVTELMLAFNQLSGTIPPDLEDLSGLTELILYLNSLTGTIPPELGSLSSLQRLWISVNWLDGPIPPELGNLTSLQWLDVSSNGLDGPIPSTLGNLSNLQRLILADNSLIGSIPPELGNLSGLTILELFSNQLTGSIPPELGSLANLEHLSLWSNQLDGSIPPELGNLSSLLRLHAENNQLTGPIPPEIGNLTNLTELWLSGNQLSGELPTELQNLVSLPDCDEGCPIEICGNQLYTDDPALLLFLQPKAGDWQNCQIPTVRFDWSPLTPIVDEVVQFTDNTTSFPTSWSWTFGDGGSSGVQDPTHIYTSANTFTVTLTASNSLGNDSASQSITVVPLPPTADFTWAPTRPVAGQPVQFTDTSTGSPNSFWYEFGDGIGSPERDPIHVYAAPGTYDVRHVVANAGGNGEVTKQVTVDPAADPPVAFFAWDPVSPDVNDTVSFFDYSTGDPTSWSWDFGDGATSNLQEPMHAYTAGGIFTVALTVSNAAGSHVASDDITVGEAPVTPRDEVPVTAPGVVEEGTDIDTDRSGNRVVVWSQDGDRAKAAQGLLVQGDGAGVFGRYFDPDDAPEGDVFEAAESADAAFGSPTVSFDGAGNFVVGWETEGGTNDGVFGRSFDPDRQPLTGVFPVDEGAGGSPSAPDVATASGGDFVTVWRDDDAKHLQTGAGVFGRFFEPDGAPKGETIRVDSGDAVPTSEPSVATAAGGHTLVVWSQRASYKQVGDGVFGRYFDPDGSPQGDPSQVNDDPAGETSDPSVGVDPSGSAVVVWAQDQGTADGWDIFGRRLDREGQALGEQFIVNTETVGDQTDPSVDVNAAGDFAVAWASGTDGVFGRYFNPSGTPLGPQFPMAEPVGGVTPTDPEISLGDDRTISLAYVRIGDDDTGQALLRTFDVDSLPSPCSQGANTNCLNRERFQVRVSWRDFQGNTGDGLAVRLTDDTGYYWFFDQANVEVMLKVLDGCSINGSFWVFYGALSNVEYTIVVTDSDTGSSVSYFNPSGNFASVGDTGALPCNAKAGHAAHAFRDVPAQEWSGTIVAEQTATMTDTCTPDQTTLCLNDDRFRIEATWRDFQGNAGTGDAVTLTGDTGYFWFFDQANVELVIKALDARGINGCFWVFFGALSNVEYTITVTDTETGTVKRYINPLGTFGSLGDTEAFCVP